MATIIGTAGSDLITTTTSSPGVGKTTGGADSIDGNAGDDTIKSGGGADTIDGDTGNDSIEGGDGADAIYASDGSDTLDGGAGTDWIEVTSSSNIVDDTLISVEAARFGSSSDELTLTSTQLASFKQFQSSGSSYVTYHFQLAGGPSATVGATFDNGSRAVEIDGSAGNDVLSFSASTFNTIYFDGGAGNDKFTGGSGGDGFYTSDGSDTLNGAAGIDWIEVTSDSSIVDDKLISVEAARFGSSSDELTLTTTQLAKFTQFQSSGASYVTYHFQLAGGPAKTVTTTFDNGSRVVEIDGWAGNDSLKFDASIFNTIYFDGGAGNDKFTGGSGGDGFYTSDGRDTLNGAAGTDWIEVTSDSSIVDDKLISVEAARFGSSSDELTLTTTQLAKFTQFQSSGSSYVTYHFQLAGGPAATVGGTFDNGSRVVEIDGWAGNDSLKFDASIFNTIYFDGGAGNDNFTGGSGGDGFYTSDGSDTLNGAAGIDWIEVTSDSSIVDDTLISVEAARFGSSSDELTLTTTQLANFTEFQSSGSSYVTYHFQLAGGPAATVDGTFDNGSRVVEIDGSAGNDTLSFAPSVVNSVLFEGGTGNDDFTGGSGGDSINGEAGADTLTGVRGNNVFFGTLSELNGDTITDFDAFDTLHLEGVSATTAKIKYIAASNNLQIDGDGNGSVDAVIKLLGTFQGTFEVAAGSQSNTTDITFTPDASTGGADSHIGTNGEDGLAGLDGNDSLDGSLGADTLDGGAGDDRLTGGADADRLVGGGGGDTFAYNALSDSLISSRDTIAGFDGAGAAAGDRIDLSTIDAIAGVGGNQAFTFIGTAAFSAAGQVRVVNDATNTNTVIELNTGGSLDPDMAIVIADAGVTAAAYSAADFIL